MNQESWLENSGGMSNMEVREELPEADFSQILKEITVSCHAGIWERIFFFSEGTISAKVLR